MYRSTAVVFSVLALLVSLGSGDQHLVKKGHHSRRNLGVNRMDAEPILHQQVKRGDKRFSTYSPGLGACGNTNGPNDYIVALNMEMFDTGSYCGQTITISYNGKTAQATIQDRCEGCGYGGIDLTPGLFSYFASLDAGIIYGDWHSGAEAPPPPPPPSPSPTPTPTTSSTSTSSSSSTTSQTSASTTSNSASTPSAPPSAESSNSTVIAGNLELVNEAVLGIGKLLSGGN